MNGFLADRMLKKLARWLRILGFDTLYPEFVEDDRILGLSLNEDRVLLTQDVELASRAKKAGCRAFLVPRDGKVEGQVAAVLREFNLSFAFPENTRCPACNGRLEVVGKNDVEGNPSAPAGVVARNESFWLCGTCGKVYWRGSHWGRIEKSVEEIKRNAS
jgi:uncharacterized protein